MVGPLVADPVTPGEGGGLRRHWEACYQHRAISCSRLQRRSAPSFLSGTDRPGVREGQVAPRPVAGFGDRRRAAAKVQVGAEGAPLSLGLQRGMRHSAPG
ncbi:hypothetical protein NDU88_003196 [Pleurodeles waltl]|uniref:Uncharacterized protein n=1 Tax=Pleurodeles waltl TaxID=8319 RepID=A0AAV7UXR5_PLEWA|nr:hypothetical protein NDU88_003196 [Pleurodeles waltl]